MHIFRYNETNAYNVFIVFEFQQGSKSKCNL